MTIQDKDELKKFVEDRALPCALVVTALALEMEAVRTHLTQLCSISGSDGTVYECGLFSGQVGDWLVIVGESGAGTHLAQSTVTNACRTFEGLFEVIVFVGIAASRKKEASIGSVVASTILHYPTKGKYQPGGEFTDRPDSIRSNARLINYARKVKRDGEWCKKILLTGSCPEVNSELYPKPYPPEAHLGPIASIESVSADPDSELEANITSTYNDTIAIEMEGWGASHAASREETPCIVIRGISDMRKGKSRVKDKAHQPVAAAHAAAFAIQLLETWLTFERTNKVPMGVDNNNPLPTVIPTTTQPESIAPNTSTKIVLNFGGDKKSFTKEAIEEILNTVRNVTNDPNLKIIGIEEGSVRLIIEGDKESLDKLYEKENLQKLTSGIRHRLLGVVYDSEYRNILAEEELLITASADLLHWPKSLPQGTHFERPELNQLLSIFESEPFSTTVVLGGPGSGKSALLSSLGMQLSEKSIRFLAIKADLLDPSIRTEEELAESLGLPGTVSGILGRLSKLRPVALLIDQLDALAGYVDLKTGRLSVLINLVRKLSGQNNIHIILSSRTFEFEHDSRLRSIRAESILLAMPPLSAVLKVLEEQNINASGWPTDAQELLRTPQALATFLKFKDAAKHEPFRSYQAMLDKLWHENILSHRDGARISALAGKIAELMAEKETLWVSAIRFQDEMAELDALIAMGILTDYEGNRQKIGFYHQTVFEHALARSFAQRDGGLSTFIKERQSSLFIRPKLWAALTYLRGVEEPTYTKEITLLWNIPGLRRHLRHLLIEFLGQQSSPSMVESSLMSQVLRSSERPVGLQAILGSAGWFSLFSSTFISEAMQSKAEASYAASILERAWIFAPEKVKSLIRRNWLNNTGFDDQLWFLIKECPSWDDDTHSIAIELLERSEPAPYFFEHLVSTLGVSQPGKALALVRKRLDMQLEKSIAIAKEKKDAEVGKEKKLDVRSLLNQPHQSIVNVIEQQDGLDGLEALAKSDPVLFLENIWPWFIRALRALMEQKGENNSPYPGFPLAYILDYRFEEESSHGLNSAPLLGAITTAAETLASEYSDEFLEWIAKNEHEKNAPCQCLFAHAFTKSPELYAERAAQFLSEDLNRLHLRSVSVSTSERLIRCISSYWSSNTFELMERVLSEYTFPAPIYLSAKEKRDFNLAIRETKYSLLRSLDEGRLSKETKRLIDEEKRRFGDRSGAKRIVGPQFIGSPMSSESLALASDEDILNAFIAIPDSSGWDHPTEFLKGGNIQLARQFAEFTKENPERAIRIIRSFKPHFGSRGAGYAIDALAPSYSPEAIELLILELNEKGFAADEFRYSAARAVTKLVDRDYNVSDLLIKKLELWLQEPSAQIEDESVEDEIDLSQDQPPFETKGRKARKNKPEPESRLWRHGGLFALPGGNYPVLEAITRVYLDRKDYSPLLNIYITHLKRNEQPKVWEGLVNFIQYIRPDDPELLSHFVSELFRRFPSLLTTPYAATMLAHIHWRVADCVHSQLQVMGAMQDDQAQLTYGELTALIAMAQPNLEWAQQMLAEIVQEPGKNWAQVGAANTAVNIWNEPKARKAASRVLIAIIPIAGENAWHSIIDLFRQVDEITPEQEWVEFLKAFADHMHLAPWIDSTFIIDRLQTLLPHHALLIADIAKKLIDKWGQALSDGRTRVSSNAQELVDLTLTLHRLGPETREIGITLFEDLLVISSYEARSTLDQLDNRFKTQGYRARPRLPRRARRKGGR